MTAKQSEEQPITITSAKLPSTTTLSEERLRHIEPLVHETFNSELGDTGDYEGHSIIRTENGGIWYAELINPDDDYVEDHAEIVRRVNAFPSLLHAAEQMAKVVEANNKLRWALESQPCTCLDGDPCVRCVGLSEWKVDLPPAPEKGGYIHGT